MPTNELTFTEKVIIPINQWFPRYSLTEPQASLYYRCVRNLDGTVWGDVMQHLLETYRGRTPPTIPEICQAHATVMKEKFPPKTSEQLATEKRLSYWQTADRVIETPIGKTAYHELWLPSLIEAVRSNPNLDLFNLDVWKFRDAHKAARESAATLNSKDPLDNALIKLWQSMQERMQMYIDRYKDRVGDSPAVGFLTFEGV